MRPTRTNTTTTLADGTTVNEQSETPSATIARGFAPHLRAVEIRREGEPAQTFDLMRYRRTGDPNLNPYLRDGDRVYVPAYHTTRDVAFVSGAVPFPGPYPIRPNDTAADLIAAAGGTPSDGSVRVVSASGESRMGAGERVTSGTTVFVESDRQLGIVVVEGEVAYPGSYRIVPGETTGSRAHPEGGWTALDRAGACVLYPAQRSARSLIATTLLPSVP